MEIMLRTSGFARLVFVGLVVLTLFTIPGGSASAASDPYLIQPVLAYPTNLTLNSDYQTSIADALDDISLWIKEQTAGGEHPQHIESVETRELPETWQTYCQVPSTADYTTGQLTCNGDPAAIISDLDSHATPLPETIGHAKYIYLIFVQGLGAYAGGAAVDYWTDYYPAGGGGWAILGQLNLDYAADLAYRNSADVSWESTWCSDPDYTGYCTQDAQIGTIGHEMLHTFRVPHHPDGSQSLSTIEFLNYPDALLLDDWPNYEKRAIGESPFTDSPVESPFSTGDIPSPVNDLDASASCGGEMTVSWTNTTDDITAHFVRLAKGFQARQAAHATIQVEVATGDEDVTIDGLEGGNYYWISILELNEVASGDTQFLYNQTWSNTDSNGPNNAGYLWVPDC